MKHKIEFKFPEEVIDRISRDVIESLFSEMNEYISEGIRYDLLDDDTLKMITKAIQDMDNCNLNKIELSIISARGQLYSQVKKRVYEKLIKFLPEELEELN